MKKNVVTETITGDSSLARISKRTAWLAALSATLFGLSNPFSTALGDGREFSRSGSRDFMNRGISRAGDSHRFTT